MTHSLMQNQGIEYIPAGEYFRLLDMLLDTLSATIALAGQCGRYRLADDYYQAQSNLQSFRRLLDTDGRYKQRTMLDGG